MFEKLNNLESGIIKGKQVEDLLKILANDYFDNVEKNETLIVYNYKTFHSVYGSLLNAITNELNDTLKELQSAFNELWEDYKKSKEKNTNVIKTI